MSDQLVSVIIPTYNRARFLTQALDSVLQQTYQNFEIIVVDDGSTDNTSDVVSKYLSETVKYVFKKNSGPSAARNTGIRMARGGYIAFLDSDGLWDPCKLEVQIAAFSDDPAVGIIFSNARYIDEDGLVCRESMAEKGYVFGGDFIREVAEYRFPHASDTVLLRRSVLHSNEYFDESLRLAEDIDLWIRIALKTKVGYLDQPLASVRIHTVSLMRQTSPGFLRIRAIQVLGRYRNEVEGRFGSFNTCVAEAYDYAANEALLRGERGRALMYYLKALTSTPLCIKRYKDFVRCFLPLTYLRQRYDAACSSMLPLTGDGK